MTMTIEWPEYKDGRPTGRMLSSVVPADIEFIAEIIGVVSTVSLLLAFGGAHLYVAKKSLLPDGEIAEIIGVEHAQALGRKLGGRTLRLPIGNEFIARVLRAHGVSINEIARKTRK